MDATVRVPASKSQTNRALVLAALAAGPTVLRDPLRARDTRLMAEALATLGCRVDDVEGGDWRVTPGTWQAPARVECGLAGTVMRFVPPVAALAAGPVTFDGDPRARERPMAALLDALRALDVPVDDGGRGRLPFTVRGRGGVRGGRVSVDASGSSQFVSALLLAGCRYDEGLVVRSVGPVLPSRPHVDMTLAMLAAAGVPVEVLDGDAWRVRPAVPRHGELAMEPDLSNAAPFLAAALVTGGRVRVPGWPARTAQPGDAVRDLLTALGGQVTRDADGLVVTGSGRVHGADLDMQAVGELVPVVAAVAALAESPTTIRGVAHLRGHETDRLSALAAELTALGGDVRETADGLEIRPRPLHGGTVATYDDHRLATAAAVLGLMVPGVLVENVATTGKTLPGFVDLWTGMLAG